MVIGLHKNHVMVGYGSGVELSGWKRGTVK